MMLSIPIPQAPTPVFHQSVSINVRYLVTRHDGQCKLFDYLHTRTSALGWNTLSSLYIPTTDIVVPLDMYTAYRLGLIDLDELQLTAGQKAFLNILTP